jgi:23S rRNA pseudouridine1911/1915/1917 synthase
MNEPENLNLDVNLEVETGEEILSLTFQPAAEDVEKRLDAFLAEKIEGWSRSRLQKLIDDGDILVGGKTVKSSYKLHAKDEIEVELTDALVERFEPENIPIEIVFEDEYFAVINKPAGMVVHPGAGVKNGTLANAVAYHFGLKYSDFDSTNQENTEAKFQSRKSRIGIVHRLDKNTSGLIVVAKNETIHEGLAEQFRNREVYKSYIALAHGRIETQIGKIEAAIGRDVRQRTRMAIVKAGRQALTLWKVRQRFDKFTLLDVEIKTGRTHQIRVHLASIKHPVVGDETYNGGRDKTVNDATIRKAISELNRFFLHAEKLGFVHPKTKEKMSFTAPLPGELTSFLELL